MKTKFAILLAILFFTGIACNRKVDIEKEKAAIKAVIEEETAAFIAHDFNRLAKTHLQDESTIRIDQLDSAVWLTKGWKSIGDTLKSWISSNLSDFMETFKNSDYQIKVYSESAWAVFNQKTESDYHGKHYIDNTISTRFLEKRDGEWKIVYLSYVNLFDKNGKMVKGDSIPVKETKKP